MRILPGLSESLSWSLLHSLPVFFHLLGLIFVLSLYSSFSSLVVSHLIGLKQTMNFKKNVAYGSCLQRAYIYSKLNSYQTAQVDTPNSSLSISMLHPNGFSGMKQGTAKHQAKLQQSFKITQNR